MFLDGQNHPEFNATGGDPNSSIFAQIVEFAKNLPLFSDLNMEAQVIQRKKKSINFIEQFRGMKIIFLFTNEPLYASQNNPNKLQTD